MDAGLVPADRAGFACMEHALGEGHAVIANVVTGSPFTRGGHYLVIASVKEGRIRIADPNPKNMSLPDWTDENWLEGGWARHFLIVGPKA